MMSGVVSISRRRNPIRSSSLIFACLWLMILVHRGVGFPSADDIIISYNRANTRLMPPTQTCNGNCIIDTNDCTIAEGFCYIEGLCREENETRVNDSLSCLQCQSNKTQTNWSFNPFCSPDEMCSTPMFLGVSVCSNATVEAFYKDSREAITNFYNFDDCSRDRKQCQAGFFLSPRYRSQPYACCPGYFCPEGQICMIPCRKGSYCPSELSANNGTCKSAVTCPKYQLGSYEAYGCGGSIIEGFCPAGSFCPSPMKIQPCPNASKYCPTGVEESLDCPSGFVCLEGRARRQRIITNTLISVLAIIVGLVVCAEFSQWILLKKQLFGKHELADPPGVSDYFRKANPSSRSKPQYIQLHIHLEQAKLRNVTHFDPVHNEGFTGRITAGKLTALMGGSGCGKSSLLETIHGRRRLRKHGSITFAEHEPLSNLLTDYVGYVPQADIMHNDLTVFETVYYSARTRRLNHSKQTIINDVCFVLDKLGLGTMHNNFTKTLSGGQRKRVNVAIEISACPKVLLLDEPTSGLDTVSCDDLFDLLQLIKFSAAGPVTIITVIHQPSHELFEKIDEIFFLTPKCCLAYQGPRHKAKEFLKKKIFANTRSYPTVRHNDCDTCFIMLTHAKTHLDNHKMEDKRTNQSLVSFSWGKRAWFPFYYVLLRSIRQTYIRGAIAEAAYLLAYFLLGACLGYLFENKQQGTCDIDSLPTIYFLISLAFGILTCISSQRLFGVETTDQTFERESRNYFHPFQYWLAKSLVDIIRMICYPLLFLSMLYIEVVPRGPFSYYLGVMILLSFVCSGIGQLTSVIFNRTEYAYLAGTIIALLSCLLSGFSPTKTELGRADFILTISFSRHVQNLFFRHETGHYLQGATVATHIWGVPVGAFRQYYDFNDNENPYFWLIFIGFVLRALTFLFLYGKSEYRSKIRFNVTNLIPNLQSLFKCEQCRERSHKPKYSLADDDQTDEEENDAF